MGYNQVRAFSVSTNIILTTEFGGLIGNRTSIGMEKRILSLVTFFLFAWLCVFSQTVINVEKPGKLKSRIGKNAAKITALKIIGTLNEKDVLAFRSLTSVTYLDLSEADFLFKNKSIKWKDEKGKHEVTPSENEIPLFSTMPLKNLYLPDSYVKAHPVLPSSAKYSKRIKILDGGQITLDNIYAYYPYPNKKSIYVKIANFHYLRSFVPSSKFSPQTYIDAYGSLEYRNLIDSRSENRALTIDTLFLSSIGDIGSAIMTYYNPSVVVCVKEGIRLLNAYRGNDSIVDLNDVDGIGVLAFANSKVTNVKLGEKIKTIPAGCFYGCNELKEVSGLENIKAIGDYAFYGTSIENFVFGESLMKLSSSALVHSGVRNVEIKARYAPELTKSKSLNEDYTGVVDIPNEAFDLITFVVPKDALKYYSIGEWGNKCVIGKDVKNAYTFTIETPGTLHEQITDELAPQIVELTIKGFLYETDFVAIRKCKNLRSIDLSHCFPMKSPSLQKEEYEEDIALDQLAVALFGLAADYEQTKANTGLGDVTNVVQATMYKEIYDNLMKTYDTHKFKADASCWMPEDGFENLRFLERVIYPNQLKVLNTGVDSKVLKEIGFPPFVEDIKCGFVSNHLKSIELPASVKEIRQFGGRNIEVIDLSKTQITKLGEQFGSGYDMFKDCKSVRYFYAPKNLKSINSSELDFDNKKAIGYFYTPEMPFGMSITHVGYEHVFKEVHIPRHCKSGWNMNTQATVIDDIDVNW